VKDEKDSSINLSIYKLFWLLVTNIYLTSQGPSRTYKAIYMHDRDLKPKVDGRPTNQTCMTFYCLSLDIFSLDIWFLLLQCKKLQKEKEDCDLDLVTTIRSLHTLQKNITFSYVATVPFLLHEPDKANFQSHPATCYNKMYEVTKDPHVGMEIRV
jgi:hypothetical protein